MRITAASPAFRLAISSLLACSLPAFAGDSAAELRKAFIDGDGPGWRTLTLDDFVNVNCDRETWSTRNGMIHCTGTPIGVARLKRTVKNFELVLEWRHLKSAGNSGVFVWVSQESLRKLNDRARLPSGIEVQVLDHGYREQYEKSTGKQADWFTTHGDVFSVGEARIKPFPPASPDGRRSFPRKNLSKGVGEWNHYYVRGINGEVRLWVNGEEVSGGSDCHPDAGYLCLESEGSPIDFKNIRLRLLP
jgi:Domain of Unknown Function (DUF1080)